jgi:hypothetical protein
LKDGRKQEETAVAIKALHNQMNRVVRVNRAKLIETLRENLAKHVAQFNEAMAGYKDSALAKIAESFDGLADRLDKRKTEIIATINAFTPETADAFADHLTILHGITVNLKVPVSYADAYGAAIDMALFDTRDELELSGAEFQCFCRDVWDWSEDFTSTSQLYLKK